jgi:hypothetical protein
MTLSTRLVVICSLLLAASALQWVLWYYLESPGQLQPVELLKPIKDFPINLEQWRGFAREPDDDQKLYGDEYIQRYYMDPSREQAVALWLTYSRIGDDRNHHPEVCMVAAGKVEDRAVRQTCPVEGAGDPVEQYRFTGPAGDRQWVFYWHYTLPPPDEGQLHPLQRLYQRLRHRPSSITVEVFAPDNSPADVESARQFVRLVDAALREHVGPTAIRSSSRLNVTVVEPDRLPEPK